MQSAVGAAIGQIPFVRKLYLKYFWNTRMSLFYGIFDSHAEAEKFAATLKPVGWLNDTVLAKRLVSDAGIDAPELYQTSQFAVMFWLGQLLERNSVVLDFGGAGGVFYEICNRYGVLKQPLNWHVVDLPEMVKRGRERHAALGSSMITFGTELSAAHKANVMLMLGVIQYLPDPLGEHGSGILETMSALPDHILINKIPLTDVPDAWSIQNHVSSAIACRLFNRQKLIGYFEKHGYRVRDKWIVHELGANIPFHPERSLRYYEGLYFTRV